MTSPPTTVTTPEPCQSSHVPIQSEHSCAAQGIPYIPPSQHLLLAATVTDVPDKDDILSDLAPCNDDDDDNPSPPIYPSHDTYMTSSNPPPNPQCPDNPSTYAEAMASLHAAEWS